LRTRGPYHRHKSTKKWLAIHQRTLLKRCLHMTNTGRSKAVYPHHSCIVYRHSRRKCINHTVGHCTTGVSTCPTLRGARHFPSTSYFLCLVCTQCPHIFATQSNTDEMQTPKQFTDNFYAFISCILNFNLSSHVTTSINWNDYGVRLKAK